MRIPQSPTLVVCSICCVREGYMHLSLSTRPAKESLHFGGALAQLVAVKLLSNSSLWKPRYQR
jgi:hypothetical protein